MPETGGPQSQETTSLAQKNDIDSGLQSLSEIFNRLRCSAVAKLRAEEHDARRDKAADLERLNEPYKYTQLAADSKQIRVLSIQPKQKHFSDADAEDVLSCTMATVELDDWTWRYSEFISLANTAGLPTSPRYLCALWRSMSGSFEEFGDSKYPRAIHSFKNHLREIWERSSLYDDLPFERVEQIFGRFKWGDFVALSYVWGDPKDRRNILLDGYRFSITTSLHQALHSLRDSFEVHQMKPYVWADAICINQDDMAERAAEVKKMSRIYSECLLVKAWLGHPDTEVAHEVPLVKDFLQSISSIDEENFESELRWGLLTDLDAIDPFRKVVPLLFDAPYWERTWTIQEVALAPTVLFHYGKESFNITELLKLNYILTQGMVTGNFFGPSKLDAPPSARRINLLGLSLERLGLLRPKNDDDCFTKPQVHSADLIRFAQRSKATDLRDKVFGLLALLPGSIAARIHPNYDPSFTIQETFIMFSKAWIEAEGNLRFLARLPKYPSTLPNLPSWALDVEDDQDLYESAMTPERDKIYEADLGLPKQPLAFSQSDRLLFCDGVVTDTVATLGATRVYMIRGLFGLPSRSEGEDDGDASSVLATRRNWRLALCRVLLKDSHFDFTDSPSVLDIPWVEEEEIERESTSGASADLPLDRFYEEDAQWPRFFRRTPLADVFRCALYGNEDFDVGGTPLRDYFASSAATDGVCPDPLTFMKLAFDLVDGLSGKRLFTTRGGLLGTAPRYAQPGDKIVVLSSCDMPVVLRPVGEKYEFWGSCFVEGLMNGETARAVEQGQLQIEQLSLC